jgi:hypothetical protein
VLLLSTLEHVKWSTLGDEEESAEFELTLHREMLDSEVFLPIIRERLVEGVILLSSNILGVAHPKRLLLVKMRPGLGNLLNLLGLLLLLLLLLFVDILNLWLILVLLLLLLIIRYFLLCLSLNLELDRETDELRMLLDKVLKSSLLEILLRVAFT